jgi:hypothetical protein
MNKTPKPNGKNIETAIELLEPSLILNLKNSVKKAMKKKYRLAKKVDMRGLTKLAESHLLLPKLETLLIKPGKLK